MIPSLAPQLTRAVLAPLALALTVSVLGALPATAASALTIRITSQLSPATIAVTPGTRLVWLNADDDRHRVRTRDVAPVKLDSGNLEPGESWSVTVTTPGTYAYVDERDRDDAAYHGRIVVRAGGGSGGSTATDGTGSVGGPGGGSTGSTPSTRASVVIGDGTFQPASVTIAAGGTVTWLNGDDREHTATGRAGGWDTGSLGPGQGTAERFPTPGTFAYLCAIHPEMQGTVRVVAPSTGNGPPPASVPERTPRPTPTPPTETPGGSPTAAPTLDARIVDFAFTPGRVEIAAGTTVTWTNEGIAPHTVTATNGLWDSGIVVPGGSWSREFDGPGTFTFLCSVHPAMTGTLTVTAAGAPDATGSASPPSDAAVTPSATSVTPSIDAGEFAAAPPSPPSAASDLAPAASTTSAMDIGAALRASLAIVVAALAVGWFARLIGRSTRA